MQASYRCGDAISASRYPLPAAAANPWRRSGNGLLAALPVPPCPRGHILVPSLALGGGGRFQCALEIGDEIWPLQAVPWEPDGDLWPRRPSAESAGDDRPGGNPPASAQIDCFHSEQDLPASRLLIRLHRRTPPQRFLITLSIRPLEIAPEAPADARTVLPQPPALSQMQGPKPIRRRICSPTALAMALQATNAAVSWPAVIAACFDRRSQTYGCWPLAIRCAATLGRLGAVEALASWEPALCALDAGAPLVASIRFAAGELPGAPLPRSGGHLVTLHGIDRGQVLANDPAAPDAATVPRRYDVRAFSNAWLRHRGAAYILPPK